MRDSEADRPLMLSHHSLGQLMPMHIWLGSDGTILGAGPTLQKVFGPAGLIGHPLLDRFVLRRPRSVSSLPDLLNLAGMRLQISLADPPHTLFKALVVPLENAEGALLNLSFGITVGDAVRDHKLTDSDFAPTDLAVEMLYLAETRTVVLEELRALNVRLQGAKIQAEEQALTDTLTGLRNRRGMDRALSRMLSQQIAFGLLHLDLDFFKQVNDTLGHAAGDHVLQQFAIILTEETRQEDTVARIGGDEFVILLHNLADPEGIMAVAQRILRRMSPPMIYEGHQIKAAVSIGITASTLYDAPDPDQMLIDADHALYDAKHRGRGRVSTFPVR